MNCVHVNIFILLHGKLRRRTNSDKCYAVHRTERVLVKVVNDPLLASDQRCVSLLVLLDLNETFNTTDHTILLDQLENVGFKGTALSRLKAYYNNLPLSIF